MLISGVTLPSWRIFLGPLIGDEMAIGEDLEIAIGMRREHFEQVADA